jgi:hypothetical protein
VTTGWKLDRDCRAELLARFPPRYEGLVADHVTYSGPDDEPPVMASAEIVGRADDCWGVEAMVVALNGSTDRPDGSTWHITWSLGPGREAQESNQVIGAHGWTPLDGGPVKLEPARW